MTQFSDIAKAHAARTEWIDILKGLAIFFVVLGHMPYTNESSILKTWIYSFHMPLFFVLSGFTAGISLKHSSLLDFFKKRSRSVLLPYIVWCLLSGVLFTVSVQDLVNYSWSNHLQTIIYGSVCCWFLICLYILQIYLVAYLFITTHVRIPGMKYIGAIILFAIAYVLHKQFGITSNHKIVYLTNAYVFFIPFFLGVALSLNKSFFKFFTSSKLLLFSAILICLVTPCLYKTLTFGSNYPKIIIGICTSCILITYFTRIPPPPNQQNHPKNLIINTFAYFGRYSLGIYLLHGYFISNKLFNVHSAAEATMVYSLFTLGVCFLCVFVEKIICLSHPLALLLFGRNSKST